MESTAYVVAARYGYVYHFAGMVSVEYNFALNIDADIFRGVTCSGSVTAMLRVPTA